ncbi:MAG TPA: T9SS type A sorting domain-containing protein, partial [Flavobacterium sp.]|nr:T9SS type A sorting domain-containing protein [Flavobacterium sp.]
NFPVVDNSTFTQNFCISPLGVHSDAEIVIVPTIPARPGFTAVYEIVYKNKGNQTLSGQASFTFPDDVMDLILVSVTPDAVATGVLTWNYTNLQPFETRVIVVSMNVNSPTDTPPVNIGDLLDFIAEVTLNSGTEETPPDNTFNFVQTVIGSYDPNDKICIEGNVVGTEQIGEYLHYVINFENTGTAPAQNIVVKDMIDATQFDVSSLQVMNSSHPVVARLNGNILECYFENIYLDTGGHGNVLMKIKTLSTLQHNTTVSNQAAIFFDYNAAVVTDYAHTNFQLLELDDFDIDETITVYPNPTDDVIHITAKSHITSVQLFDVQGRLLRTLLNDALTATLNIGQQSSGIYMLKIASESGSKIHKIVKK